MTGPAGETHVYRKRYLAFRIRELYRNGPDEAIRRLLGGDEVEQFWNGLRYTSLLSTQDSRMLAEYRRRRPNDCSSPSRATES